MEVAHLDVAALYAALDVQRLAREMSWRELAKEAGVSPSTLTRMGKDAKRPDVDSFARLIAWLNVSADKFIATPRMTSSKKATPNFADIAVILRAPRELSEESARHLDQLIRSTYEHLKKLDARQERAERA